MSLILTGKNIFLKINPYENHYVITVGNEDTNGIKNMIDNKTNIIRAHPFDYGRYIGGRDGFNCGRIP